MDSIVDEARVFVKEGLVGWSLVKQLADEIERLRFILEVIKNNDPRIVEIAEQALSRKIGK